LKLLLARHPPVNLPAGTCYGHTDVSLSPGWEAWAEDLAALSSKLGKQVVCYSSPASRCRSPADALGLQVVEDPRLMEMNFGRWEGCPWRDIPPPELARWRADIVNETPPGGEPLLALHRRAVDFLHSMRGYNGDGVVAITHGGTIRCLIADALGMPLGNLLRLRIEYGSLSTLTLDSSGVVVEFVNFKLVTETTKATPGGVV
jgi:alpha-ribazole phosphatase